MEEVKSILDFADGSLIERINYEMKKILENVVHPNTDDKPRKLTIEVSVAPQNDRRTVSIKTVVKKTLRPTSAVQTQMVFQSLGGEMKAYELTGIPDGQADLFGEVHRQKFFKINIMEEMNDGKQQIKELAVAGVKAETKEIDGRVYLVGTKTDGAPIYMEIEKEDDTRYPETMEVNTLNALISYITAGIANGEIKDKLYINVESPTKVSVTTPVNEYGKRKLIACARRYSLNGFSFGSNYDFESFVVALRSKFVDDNEIKELLSILKTITSSNEIVNEDNGIVQSVVAKQGTKLGATKVSPTWKLRPFRTFTEITQPESLFLLRLVNRGDETAYALHETDGGEWAIRAMTEIRDYIADTLFAAMEDAEKYGEKVFVL